MMFRTGSQLVFHMQLARRRDAAPIVRDYVTDLQRRYREIEADKLESLSRAQPAAPIPRRASPR
jgi:cyclopropane-fatty-acyl-phospholipid synthase